MSAIVSRLSLARSPIRTRGKLSEDVESIARGIRLRPKSFMPGTLDRNNGDLADALPPLTRTGFVHRRAGRIDRDDHWHVLDVELVDRFHAQIGECDHARAADRLRHEIRSAADRDQVRSAVL